MHLERRASKTCLHVCLVSKSPLGGMSFTLLIARKGERIYEAPLNGDPRRVPAFIRTQVTVRIRGPIIYIRFVIVI
jgi:hypothetical protein